MISYIPLFGVAYILFLVVHMFGLTGMMFEEAWFAIPLADGNSHRPNWSYIIIAIGILILFVEIVKATKTAVIVNWDHGLSILTLIAYCMTYYGSSWGGNSVFAIFMLLTALDVIAGLIISQTGARRDIGFGG